MNLQIGIEFIKGLGMAIVIGMGFFIIPFGLLMLINVLPWLLSKMPFIRQKFIKPSEYTFNSLRYSNHGYIAYCHPSQVIKRLKRDGLQSLFFNYHSAESPVHHQNKLGYQYTPNKFFDSANPKPVNDEFNNARHADNLTQEKEQVNHKQTEPERNVTILEISYVENYRWRSGFLKNRQPEVMLRQLTGLGPLTT